MDSAGERAAEIAAKLTNYRADILIRAADTGVRQGRRRDPAITRAVDWLFQARLVFWAQDGWRATAFGQQVRTAIEREGAE